VTPLDNLRRRATIQAGPLRCPLHGVVVLVPFAAVASELSVPPPKLQIDLVPLLVGLRNTVVQTRICGGEYAFACSTFRETTFERRGGIRQQWRGTRWA
jgi:hypothetical protein